MKLIRELEKKSGLDVYGLGRDIEKWRAASESYASLIVNECISAFCETRIEPNLEKYILARLGINGASLNIGDYIKVISGFNVGAKGTIMYIEPTGRLWVRRDGASSDVFYMPQEVERLS
jgi:hypothetical protein